MTTIARALGGIAGCFAFSRQFSAKATSDPALARSIYEFSGKTLEGGLVNLDKYRGKVLVVVNVASKWGKTKVNYNQLVSLHEKYGAEAGGFTVLAFPCNQFGSQEPGSAAEIRAFADKFNVKFDMFEKCDVNGNNAHPVWVYLKEKQGGLLGNSIKWNFTKFLIDKEGQPVARYGPMDDPIPKIEKAIIEELAK